MDNICICYEKQIKLQIIKYYFLYAIGYSIAISSKTIILGFIQPFSCIYKICDLSSFVFDHNSTKDSIVWRNIVYILHSVNPPSVLEITASFQLLPKPPHTFTRNLLQIC